MKRKPIVGETLYSLNVGNRAGRYTPQKLTPCVVTKVGNKYFYIGANRDDRFQIQFHIDTWREKTEYCVNHHLYETEQEWEDDKEKGNLRDKLRDAFYMRNGCKLSLDQLRRLVSILNELPSTEN